MPRRRKRIVECPEEGLMTNTTTAAAASLHPPRGCRTPPPFTRDSTWLAGLFRGLLALTPGAGTFPCVPSITSAWIRPSFGCHPVSSSTGT